MSTALNNIMELLEHCSPDELEILSKKLREDVPIHQLEVDWSCGAEVILEAIHRAPELTRRMLKGVVADASFHLYVVPELAQFGWKDVPITTNEAYDHMLEDRQGRVTIQVKLQRSEKGSPVETRPRKYGKAQYIVEVQKTRTGKKKEKGEEGEAEQVVDTRPYRFGEFEILAVSMWPSTGDWKKFRYTVGTWLIPRPNEPHLIAVMQPVAMVAEDGWTDDFPTVVQWLRSRQQNSVMPIRLREPSALDNLLLAPSNSPDLFSKD
jgi:hypothetical protein